MNNFLKTAFVAAGVVGTVGAVSTAEAANFNVVVDKITAYTDGNNAFSGTVIYEPANNVGSSSTQTVDLLNASQKQGTTLGVAVPPANTYETLILELSTMEISGTTVSSDISGTFAAANGFADVNTGETRLVLALGNVGANLNTALGTEGVTIAAGAGLPMQPTTISGAGFTFPALNLELDGSTIDDDATTAAGLVSAFPVATTVNNNTVDSATRPNMDVAVNWALAFDPVSTTASYTSGTSVVSVGLFDTALSARPYAVETVTSSSSAASGTVTFTDVVSATVVPLAWLDADSDGKLDTGEYFTSTIGAGTVAATQEDLTLVEVPTGVTDISTSSADFTSLDADGIDQQAIAFGPRTQNIVVQMPAVGVTASQIDGSWNGVSSLSGLITGTGAVDVDDAATAATLTIITETNATAGVSRTFTVSAAIGVSGTAGTADQVEDGEGFFVGLASQTAADSVTGISWATSGTAGALTVENVPLDIDAVADGANTGTYLAEFKVEFADADDALPLTTFGTIDENGGAGTILSSDGTLNVTTLGATATSLSGAF